MKKILENNTILTASLAAYVIALVLQWDSYLGIAVSDVVGYITSGVNLIKTGNFTNPFGGPEVWFPPVFPFLTGCLVNYWGMDAVSSARLISAAASVMTLYLVFLAGRQNGTYTKTGVIAVLLLVVNPLFQFMGTAPLSEALATCLAVLGFFIWIGMKPQSGAGPFIKLGCVVALSYLTRPEAILLLPAWLGIDVLVGRRSLFDKRHVAAVFCCFLILLPYVYYLKVTTGKWQLSNKTQVNLAAGRAAFHGGSRERINSETLAIEFTQYPHDIKTEMRRYAWNMKQVVFAYLDIFRPPLAMVFWGLTAYGCWVLAVHRRWRFLLGTLAGLIYIFILALFSVNARYLHATLPFLALLSATGACHLMHSFQYRRLPRMVILLCVLIGGVLFFEAYTRQIRWTLGGAEPPLILIKEAAARFRQDQLADTDCLMFEHGATFGYYSGCTRRRLTGDSLDLVIAHMRCEKGEDVYLTLYDGFESAYSPDVYDLFQKDHPHLETVFETTNDQGRVKVFKLVETNAEALQKKN
ncbi:MAG TPA: hypothetical protein DHV36_13005 [Desulfobacteraceae bacterium]|nr:hypothetical protein [Desulfobacteraceae bacterium]